MKIIFAWLELVWAILWMGIADTWIAKRMRRPTTLASRVGDAPSGDDLALERGITIARIVVALIGLSILAVGFLIGWLARSLTCP